jgi:hypothetical protein
LELSFSRVAKRRMSDVVRDTSYVTDPRINLCVKILLRDTKPFGRTEGKEAR